MKVKYIIAVLLAVIILSACENADDKQKGFDATPTITLDVSIRPTANSEALMPTDAQPDIPTPVSTAPPVPTDTPTLEPTSTPEPTTTPTNTPTPIPTNTPTKAPTATPKPTKTPSPKPTATPTNTPKPTSTPTTVPTPTNILKPTATLTPKPTATPTNTPEPTAIPTPTEAVDTSKYDIVSGYQINKLPYKTNGLTIVSVEFGTYETWVKVKNETGTPISERSCITYKCYDKDDTVLHSGTVYLQETNNGAICAAQIVRPLGTARILFFEATVVAGKNTEDKETEIVSGYTVNKLPYRSNGLTVVSIEFGMYETWVKVKNETGKPISSRSCITYKCYDKDGAVLYTGTTYLPDTNTGMTCAAQVVRPTGTKKIIFEEATVIVGKVFVNENIETETISGYQVNKLPYTTNGLTIIEIEFGTYETRVKVKNQTGSSISSYSHISYVCIDSDGVVRHTGEMYLKDIDDGEVCAGSVVRPTGTTKILFGEGAVK